MFILFGNTCKSKSVNKICINYNSWRIYCVAPAKIETKVC